MDYSNAVSEILEELCPEVDSQTCTTLVTDQYLDSLALVALVADLEDSFDIEIPPIMVTPDNFNSAAMIGHLVGTLIEEAGQVR